MKLKNKFAELAERRFSEKQRTVLIVLAFAASVLPLLAISVYNHPSADDFNYSVLTHQVWQETGSVLQVLKAAVETAVYYFNEWEGLYAAPFFLALQPGIFGETAYMLTPWMTIGSLIAANLLFFHVLVRKILKGTKSQWLQLSAIGLFLMVNLLPSAVEGFYWHNGAFKYTTFHALLLALLCLTWHLEQPGVRWKPFKLAVLTAATVVLAGCNHVTTFLGILLYLSWGAGYLLAGRKKKSVLPFLMGLVMAAGFIVNLTAPGTAVRQATCLDRPGVIGTIVISVSDTLRYYKEWMHPFFWVCLAAAVPAAYGTARRFRRASGFSYPCPLLLVIGMTALQAAMHCPSVYAQGFSGNYRLINVSYYVFIIQVLFFLVYILGWLSVKVEKTRFSQLPDRLEQRMSWMTWGGAAIYLLVFVVALYPSYEDVSGINALTSLANGKAAQYDREADARTELLTAAGEDDIVELEPFSVTPKVLFFEDLDPSADNWKNQAAAEYYDVGGIILEEDK